MRFEKLDARASLPKFLGNIVLFDVLHYLEPPRQAELLPQLAARVAPGGMLLLRDCPRDGSARFWATYLGEIFGGDFSVRLPADWEGTEGRIAEAFNQANDAESRQEPAPVESGDLGADLDARDSA